MNDRCAMNGKHIFTPWVQERYQPSLDTRCCRCCSHYEVRLHVKGTEQNPYWLYQYIASKEHAAHNHVYPH